METLTIAVAGKEKEVQTKFGLKKKQGVQFKEYGQVWHDVWAGGLKVGQTLQGTRTSREYEGKTYWNFALPKKEDAINEKLDKLLKKVDEILSLAKEHKQGEVATEIDYPENDGIEPNFDI